MTSFRRVFAALMVGASGGVWTAAFGWWGIIGSVLLGISFGMVLVADLRTDDYS
jgi:glucose dehydrogenase